VRHNQVAFEADVPRLTYGVTDHVALRSTPITPIESIPVLWRDEKPISNDAGLEDPLGHRGAPCLKDWASQPQSS
jgi:hypothetical protein